MWGNEGFGFSYSMRNETVCDINNAIIQNNSSGSIEIWGGGGELNINYSNIQGGYDGVGNIDSNPQFCDPENGDFHLAESSPSVGMGQNGSNMGALGVGCVNPVMLDEIAVPSEFTMTQNFPNPFNPNTSIKYGLPEDTELRFVIYDIRGSLVSTIHTGIQPAGWYDVIWNGITDDGQAISTGIYFARLQAGDYSRTIKMVYLK